METRDRLERQARDTDLRWRLETGYKDRLKRQAGHTHTRTHTTTTTTTTVDGLEI